MFVVYPKPDMTSESRWECPDCHLMWLWEEKEEKNREGGGDV